jgi:hypothetical protein
LEAPTILIQAFGSKAHRLFGGIACECQNGTGSSNATVAAVILTHSQAHACKGSIMYCTYKKKSKTIVMSCARFEQEETRGRRSVSVSWFAAAAAHDPHRYGAPLLEHRQAICQQTAPTKLHAAGQGSFSVLCTQTPRSGLSVEVAALMNICFAQYIHFWLISEQMRGEGFWFERAQVPSSSRATEI